MNWISARSFIRLVSLAGEAQGKIISELLRSGGAFGIGFEWVSVSGGCDLKPALDALKSGNFSVLLILSVESRAEAVHALAALDILAPLSKRGKLESIVRLAPEWKTLEAKFLEKGCFLALDIEEDLDDLALEAASLQGIERLCDREVIEWAKASQDRDQIACFLLAEWASRPDPDPALSDLMDALRNILTDEGLSGSPRKHLD